MSDKSASGNKDWNDKTRKILDQSLQDIDAETRHSLAHIRRQSLPCAMPMPSHNKPQLQPWLLGGLASAACLILGLAVLITVRESAVPNSGSPPTQPAQLSREEFSMMIESMEMIEDMEMLAALGELASET